MYSLKQAVIKEGTMVSWQDRRLTFWIQEMNDLLAHLVNRPVACAEDVVLNGIQPPKKLLRNIARKVCECPSAARQVLTEHLPPCAQHRLLPVTTWARHG